MELIEQQFPPCLFKGIRRTVARQPGQRGWSSEPPDHRRGPPLYEISASNPRLRGIAAGKHIVPIRCP